MSDKGDITHIYKQDGTLVAEYVYDAFGNTEILSQVDKLGSINPFRYRGYYFDIDTKLYYLISRYYDPKTCRFISADSIEYLDPETLGGLNLYAYCCNNPVMGYDPEGTWSWKKFWKVLKVIASVAIVVVAATVAIATAGTAVGLIAAGAAIGGAIGGTINGVSCMVIAAKNGEDIFDAFADGLFSGTITGAISGAVAASPLGLGGQVAFNTALSGSQYLVESTFIGGEFNFADFLVNTLSGTIAGFVGGPGSMAVGTGLKGIIALKEVLKTSLRKSIATPIWKSTIGTIISTINNFVKSF